MIRSRAVVVGVIVRPVHYLAVAGAEACPTSVAVSWMSRDHDLRKFDLSAVFRENRQNLRDSDDYQRKQTLWRIFMGKKSFSDDASESNETTEQALVTLTLQIKEFVQNRSLDSRFAAKLVKRLKKEAEAISDRGNATKAGQKELKPAFDAADAVLRNHDAALLVTANAALREADGTTRNKKSQLRAMEG
jgi:hypothetical protein